MRFTIGGCPGIVRVTSTVVGCGCARWRALMTTVSSFALNCTTESSEIEMTELSAKPALRGGMYSH